MKTNITIKSEYNGIPTNPYHLTSKNVIMSPHKGNTNQHNPYTILHAYTHNSCQHLHGNILCSFTSNTFKTQQLLCRLNCVFNVFDINGSDDGVDAECEHHIHFDCLSVHAVTSSCAIASSTFSKCS